MAAGKPHRDAVVWFDAAAKRLNLTSEYMRDLIDQGHLPAPRGAGKREFYTEADMAGIVLFWGRWLPRRNSEVGKEPEKSGTRRKTAESEE